MDFSLLDPFIVYDHPWAAYMGRLHVIMLHFPIGFFFALILFEIFKIFSNKNRALNWMSFSLWVALVACTWLTVFMGFQLGGSGEYDEQSLSLHRNWGIYTAFLFTCIFITYWIFMIWQQRIVLTLYYFGVACGAVVLTVGSHYGGSITHGKNFLSYQDLVSQFESRLAENPAIAKKDNETKRRAVETSIDLIPSVEMPTLDVPDETRTEGMSAVKQVDVQTVINASPVYETIIPEEIASLFQKRCYQCHGNNKKKGRYRMDQLPDLFTGGESGLAAIVPGNLNHSELVRRILLPRTDEEVMPPDGKRPFTEAEKNLVITWIAHLEAQEAPDEASQMEMMGSTMMMDSVMAVQALEVQAQEIPSVTIQFVPEIDPKDSRIIHELTSLDVKFEPTLWETGGFYVNLSYVVQANRRAVVEKLANFTDRIVWLEITRRSLEREEWSLIGRLHNLERLNIRGSDASDRHLSKLTDLASLQYLHIGGTRVSANELSRLSSMPKLQTIRHY